MYEGAQEGNTGKTFQVLDNMICNSVDYYYLLVQSRYGVKNWTLRLYADQWRKMAQEVPEVDDERRREKI